MWACVLVWKQIGLMWLNFFFSNLRIKLHLCIAFIYRHPRLYSPPPPPRPTKPGFPRKAWLTNLLGANPKPTNDTFTNFSKVLQELYDYWITSSRLSSSLYGNVERKVSLLGKKKKKSIIHSHLSGSAGPRCFLRRFHPCVCVCLEVGERKPFTLTCGTPWMSSVSGLLGDWTPLREPGLAAPPGLARADMKRLRRACGEHSRRPSRCWHGVIVS